MTVTVVIKLQTMVSLLALQDDFEELDHLGQLDLLRLGAAEQVENGLCIKQLLGNDGVRVAKSADTGECDD